MMYGCQQVMLHPDGSICWSADPTDRVDSGHFSLKSKNPARCWLGHCICLMSEEKPI